MQLKRIPRVRLVGNVAVTCASTRRTIMGSAFILIVVILGGNSVTTVSQQRYTSQIACMSAQNVVLEMSEGKAKTKCVPD